MSGKTVAVVGAGPSGLVAAKVLMEDGFNVTLFDRHKELGGIWSADWAYASLRTQIVRGFMEFSDLPDTEGNFFMPSHSIIDSIASSSGLRFLATHASLSTEICQYISYNGPNSISKSSHLH